ncbi:MAG: hypothetical protein ACLR0U_33035 [Enterocloster clostridioformis]
MGIHFYQIDYTRLPRQQDSQNLDMALVLRSVPDISRVRRQTDIPDGFNEKDRGCRGRDDQRGIYLMNSDCWMKYWRERCRLKMT